MWAPFKIRVPGKWVLTGEHSVLRGATAVALPHPDFGLSLSFEPHESSQGFRVEPQTASSVISDILGSLRGFPELEGNTTFSFPSGTLRVESSIPIGAGLGSSAALCVAVSQWLAPSLNLPQASLADFATRLEHRFHGKSSGMDIAVIAAGQPILFSMEKGPQALNVKKIPRFTFHDTGVRARTRECIEKVEDYSRNAPQQGLQKDQAMHLASEAAIQGLIQYDSGDRVLGLKQIREAMSLAQQCFYAWGLVPSEGKNLETALLEKGALAIKMTGAGAGGMMVALWEDGSPG